MPLKNPEWVAPMGMAWDGDLNLSLSSMFGYKIQGVLWDELAKITDIDTQKSTVNLPLYSQKIAIAFYHAHYNQGASL